MVLRRLVVIAPLLALVSAAGVASTTAMANTTIPGPIAAPVSAPAAISGANAAALHTAVPAVAAARGTLAAVPIGQSQGQGRGHGHDRHAGGHGPAARGADGLPCVQQASCAGGALLAGATLLLLVPAAGLALPAPAPAAPVAAVPTRLRSALLHGKLFRPPRAS